MKSLSVPASHASFKITPLGGFGLATVGYGHFFDALHMPSIFLAYAQHMFLHR